MDRDICHLVGVFHTCGKLCGKLFVFFPLTPRKIRCKMAKMLFLSQYHQQIDLKGRITCPKEFRKVLEIEKYSGIIAFNSYHLDCIEAFGISQMEKLNDKLYEGNRYPFFSSADESINSIFADVRMIPLDKDGRLVLPEDLKRHARVENMATFVGRGSTFQIWNPLAFTKHQEIERQKIRDKILNGS